MDNLKVKLESGFIEVSLITSLTIILTFTSLLWRYSYSLNKIESSYTKELSKKNESTENNFKEIHINLEKENLLDNIGGNNTQIRTILNTPYPIFSTAKNIPAINWKIFSKLNKTIFTKQDNITLKNSILSEESIELDKLSIEIEDQDIFLVSLKKILIKELTIKSKNPNIVLFLVSLDSFYVEKIYKDPNIKNKIFIYSGTSTVELNNIKEEELCNLNKNGSVLVRGKKLIINKLEKPIRSTWLCNDNNLNKIFIKHRIIGYHEY